MGLATWLRYLAQELLPAHQSASIGSDRSSSWHREARCPKLPVSKIHHVRSCPWAAVGSTASETAELEDIAHKDPSNIVEQRTRPRSLGDPQDFEDDIDRCLSLHLNHALHLVRHRRSH